ncbi:MAG: ribosomal protein L7/L12 [Myxococcota bacterium]
MQIDPRHGLEARLFEKVGNVSTTSWSRFGRAASTVAYGGKLYLKQQAQRVMTGQPEVDIKTLERVIFSLGELKAVAMKMGQILSYIDPGLPPVVRSYLAALQTHSPRLDHSQVCGVLLSELGPKADALMASLSETPISAASIGQVHKATGPDGRPVAVKIRYPKIKDAVERDLGPASAAAKVLSFFYPSTKLDLFSQHVRDRLLDECDYRIEAQKQRKLAEHFVGHPDIVIPEVYPELSSEGVLTMEWIDGLHLERFLRTNPKQEIRDRAGSALYAFYYGAIFRFGLYNSDPHPGNALYMPDGRVAMLDFGAVHALGAERVRELAALTHAVHADNPDLLHRAMVGLGLISEHNPYDKLGARELMRALFGPMLHDDARPIDAAAITLTRRARKLLRKIAVPSEFLFLFRLRAGLLAVLAELGAKANWYREERRTVDSSTPEAAVPDTRKAPAADLDVCIVESGPQVLRLVRELRDITGESLRDVKDRVEQLPYTVGTHLGRDEASTLARRLTELGATVVTRESS